MEAILTAGIGIALQKIMDTAAYGTVTELYRTILVIVLCFLVLLFVNLLLRNTKQHFIKKALVTGVVMLITAIGILGCKNCRAGGTGFVGVGGVY